MAAVLLIVGELLYAIVTPLFHPSGGPDAIAEFATYADSRGWAATHAVQFASSVIVTFGLLAFVYGLNVRSGLGDLVNRFAAASAVAGLALSGALYAVDEVALKQAVDAWTSAPGRVSRAV